MSLVRKHRLYRIAVIAWGVVVLGFVVLTISGNARPFLSPDALPIDGPLQMVGVTVALIVLGALLILQLERREWKAAGKRAGLSPRGRGGIIGKPDLVGTVEGRQVRARTESRAVGGGGDSGSDSSTFTVVETDLAEPTERGLIVTAGSSPTAGMEDVPVDLANQLVTVGDVTVLGGSESFAQAVVTPRVENALTGTNTIEGVHVGESADVFLEAIEASGGGIAGSMMGLVEGRIRERMPGGPETVGTERKGVILDGADLEARARAVVAVADSFERAIEADDDAEHASEAETGVSTR